MNYVDVFKCIVIAIVFVATGNPHLSLAESINIKEGIALSNVSTSGKDAVSAAKKDAENTPSIQPTTIAGSDVPAASTAKKAQTYKKIGRAAILTFFLTFILANLISLITNARFCSNCHFIGNMKPVCLVDNNALNSSLIFLVRVFPVLLFYFAERGKFICPVCRRTSKNFVLRTRSDQSPGQTEEA